MSDDLIKHYQSLLAEHGESALALQYADRETQNARFAVLAKVAKELGSVLDVGCGLCHLYGYLRENGFTGSYLGTDIVPEFVQMSSQALSKDPDADSVLLSAEEDLPRGYDFVLLSGVFNNTMPDNERFMKSVLKKMFSAAQKGIAFNAMSTFVDYMDDGLYYADPLDVLKFCKTELGGHPVLRHDYVIREGGFPFEYAVYFYKEPVFVAP